MDVPLSIIIFLALLLATFISFLSTVLSFLTQDDITRILDLELPNSKKLHKIWLRFDESFNSFIIIEGISYAIATVLFGYELGMLNVGFWYGLGDFAIFSLVLVVLRIASYILGIKLSGKAALKLTPLYDILFTISSPLELIYDKLAEKVSGIKPEDASRDEINALVESARDEGSLDDDEYRILKNIMNFSEVLVADVMTPRTVLFTLHGDQKVGDIYEKEELNQYSRIPIWKGENMDEGIMGYALTKDILYAAIRSEKDKKISELTREINFISEETRLDKALEEFLRRRKHMFMVVDEYGGIEGLLTMEDVLETILGVEIIDEGDRVADLRVLAKQRRDKRIERKFGDS